MTEFTGRDNVVQAANTGKGTLIIQGCSASEVRQIALDATRAEVLPEARRIASQIVDERVEYITDRVIDSMSTQDPSLLVKFADPRFLAAYVSAQRSYAETGDQELANVLATLLTDLAGAAVRTRREIVLREAIECAPKLTNRHTNGLSVVLMLGRFSFTQAPKADYLLELINEFYEPYFECIPQSAFEYQYMSATSAGTFLAFGTDPYDVLHKSHLNSMYDYLEEEDIAAAVGELTQETVDELKTILRSPSPDPSENEGKPRIKLKSEKVVRLLRDNIKPVQPPLSSNEKAIREMVRNKSLKVRELGEKMNDEYPKLAEFLDLVRDTHALDFKTSPVGDMLARHEILNRAPQLRADLDAMFDD